MQELRMQDSFLVPGKCDDTRFYVDLCVRKQESMNIMQKLREFEFDLLFAAMAASAGSVLHVSPYEGSTLELSGFYLCEADGSMWLERDES